ncbi:CLUMA_CG000193, isoform A [Clunio marinus]|uniref:CLUMA_CG000193, isoform A n=1 Tax=Clunio marinus TaxID=568069 RepID=A0A1J1HI75_9DIPT|nr:CLUMA_CG000193, isoform A [Clunio marinus]
MDPYEQKLFHLFSNYENGQGYINLSGLNELIHTLQLKERGPMLKYLLMKNDTKCKVTFQEFREGLLHVITSDSDEASVSTNTQVLEISEPVTSDLESDREISPKLIVGTKKYGRRSRPTEDDQNIDDSSDSNNEAASESALRKKKALKVQRSSSQSEVHHKQRNTLKRCASLPSHKSSYLEIKLRQCKLNQDMSMDESDNMLKIQSFSQNLRSVWNNSDVNKSGSLNLQQLEIVCERVGLDKEAAKLAAEEVFDKLSIKHDDGVSFENFIKLIQSDSDVFSSMDKIKSSTKLDSGNTEDDNQIFSWSSENRIIETEKLIDLWSTANVVDAEEFLKKLGFSNKYVKLSNLICVLEEELQQKNTVEVQSSLLRGSLALYRNELSILSKNFQQLSQENQKLSLDNKESNRRASILVQEIDERHRNMEDSNLSMIKKMEMRHNEMMKELIEQSSAERDQLTQINAKLELKLHKLELNDQKLQQDFTRLKDENSALETEQMELHNQITDMLEKNIKLNQEIANIENADNNDKYDSHNEEILDLIEKIETLQMENSNLRDKNDELLCDVEALTLKLNTEKKLNKGKLSNRDLIEDQESTTTFATKRRGDSPSKSKNLEESPRTGKVPKFSSDLEELDAINQMNKEWVMLSNETMTSASNHSEPILHSNYDIKNDEHLKQRIVELEKKVVEYESKLRCNEQSTSDEVTQNLTDYSKLKRENARLTTRCQELEYNLEEMSKEYENCEDYWQSKLNEERLLFDEDQRQNDEKFAELLQKMTEIEEEQIAAQTGKNRLTPIEEKCHLENQYMELENEMEELKVHAQSVLYEKSREIEKLQLEISQLQNNSIVVKSQQRSISPQSAASSPINYLLNQNTITDPIRDYQNPNWVIKKTAPIEEVIATSKEESSRYVSPIQKPQSYQKEASNTTDNIKSNKKMQEFSDALSMNSNRSIGSNSIHSFQEFRDPDLHTSSFTDTGNGIDKMKEIRDRIKEEVFELNTQRDSLIMELQQLQEAKPILANTYQTTHPNLAQKVEKLQMKNKYLQNVLKQQQHYAETIMFQTWHQQRQELNDLRNHLEAQTVVISEQATRLASADILVKDLYVENSHLSATVQRMEQQITKQNFMQHVQHNHPKSQLGSILCKMESLPKESLVHIFKHLPHASLINVTKVCKLFHEIIFSFDLIDHLYINDKKTGSLPKLSKFRKATIASYEPSIHKNIINTVGNGLTQLYFSKCTLRLADIASILRSTPMVKIATFDYTKISDNNLPANFQDPQLDELTLIVHETDPIIFRIFQNCIFAKVDLNYYGDSPYHNFSEFLKSLLQQTKLKEISLNGLYETNLFLIPMLKPTYHLLEFKIENCDFEEWEFLDIFLQHHVETLEKLIFKKIIWDPSTILGKCVNLDYLHIQDVGIPVRQNFNNLCSIKTLLLENATINVENFSNVKFLHLTRTTPELNAICSKVMTNLLNVSFKSGDISGFKHSELNSVTLMSLDNRIQSQFFHENPKIECLTISDVYTIDDNLLSEIMKNLTKLKTLKIFGDNLLTSKAFNIIRDNGKSLKVFEMKKWNQKFKKTDWNCLYEITGLAIYVENLL